MYNAHYRAAPTHTNWLLNSRGFLLKSVDLTSKSTIHRRKGGREEEGRKGGRKEGRKERSGGEKEERKE